MYNPKKRKRDCRRRERKEKKMALVQAQQLRKWQSKYRLYRVLHGGGIAGYGNMCHRCHHMKIAPVVGTVFKDVVFDCPKTTLRADDWEQKVLKYVSSNNKPLSWRCKEWVKYV